MVIASVGILEHASGLLSFFVFIVPCGKFGSPYLGMEQQPQEQRYPFLSVCVVFWCVQTVVWLPVFGIFNVRTDSDAGELGDVMTP